MLLNWRNAYVKFNNIRFYIYFFGYYEKNIVKINVSGFKILVTSQKEEIFYIQIACVVKMRSRGSCKYVFEKRLL